MKFFSGKRDKNAPASPGARRRSRAETDSGADAVQPSHRLTVDLARAEQLAAMLASSRAAKFIEVADLLAGMYIYEWDRLSKFWDERDEIESFLRKICGISPQRWSYWIEFYDRRRREDEEDRLSTRRKSKNRAARQKALQQSIELQKLLRWAEEMAPFWDSVDGRQIPILTSECVLLCMAMNDHSEVSRTLCETGLDLEALERAAHNPRRAPLR